MHSAYAACPTLGHDGYPVDWNQWARFDEGLITYLTAPVQATVTPPDPTFLQRIHGGTYTTNRIIDARWTDLASRASIEAYWQRPMLVLPKI